MRLLSPSSNEEMVAVFLLGELDSPRFAETIQAALRDRKLSKALIEKPNLDSSAENAQRAAILLEYRPWLVDFGLLKEWPPNAMWHWAELNREDIENLHYVTYSYWDELSSGTHLVQDGAKSVKAGRVVFEVGNDNFWEVARRIDAGETMRPIIILSDGERGPHTVIEGHTRATSYLLADHAPRTVHALFGITQG